MHSSCIILVNLFLSMCLFFSHVFVKTGHQQPFKLQDIFITVKDGNVAAFSTVHSCMV